MAVQNLAWGESQFFLKKVCCNIRGTLVTLLYCLHYSYWIYSTCRSEKYVRGSKLKIQVKLQETFFTSKWLSIEFQKEKFPKLTKTMTMVLFLTECNKK